MGRALEFDQSSSTLLVSGEQRALARYVFSRDLRSLVEAETFHPDGAVQKNVNVSYSHAACGLLIPSHYTFRIIEKKAETLRKVTVESVDCSPVTATFDRDWILKKKTVNEIITGVLGGDVMRRVRIGDEFITESEIENNLSSTGTVAGNQRHWTLGVGVIVSIAIAVTVLLVKTRRRKYH